MNTTETKELVKCTPGNYYEQNFPEFAVQNGQQKITVRYRHAVELAKIIKPE